MGKLHQSGAVRTIYGVSNRTLYRLRVQGLVKATFVNGRWYYDVASLERHFSGSTESTQGKSVRQIADIVNRKHAREATAHEQ